MKLTLRITIILFALIYFDLNLIGQSKDLPIQIKLDELTNKENGRIYRIDTIENSDNLLKINSFDTNNQIVKIESFYNIKVLGLKFKQVQVFDLRGNLILDLNDGIVPCYFIYSYNENNKLITERIVFIGIEEKRIEYQYDNKGTLINKIEYENGMILNNECNK